MQNASNSLQHAPNHKHIIDSSLKYFTCWHKTDTSILPKNNADYNPVVFFVKAENMAAKNKN